MIPKLFTDAQAGLIIECSLKLSLLLSLFGARKLPLEGTSSEVLYRTNEKIRTLSKQRFSIVVTAVVIGLVGLRQLEWPKEDNGMRSCATLGEDLSCGN